MKKRYSRETRRVVLHTLMFFSPFFSGRPFRPFGIFCLRLFFVSRSRNPSIRFALTHPCATGQYRLVLYTAICSALVRFYVFHTQREYEKNTRETFNESANIDHDNVFHSRSDSGCNVRFSGDQCRRNSDLRVGTQNSAIYVKSETLIGR